MCGSNCPSSGYDTLGPGSEGRGTWSLEIGFVLYSSSSLREEGGASCWKKDLGRCGLGCVGRGGGGFGLGAPGVGCRVAYGGEGFEGVFK